MFVLCSEIIGSAVYFQSCIPQIRIVLATMYKAICCVSNQRMLTGRSFNIVRACGKWLFSISVVTNNNVLNFNHAF